MTFKRTIKIVPSIILLLTVLVLFQVNTAHAQPKTPIEAVKIFIAGYGTSRMDEAADVTTANFRDDRPKSVWVVKMWEMLHSIEYAHIRSKVVATKVKDRRAVVLVDAEITSAAADAKQKEIYTLVKEGASWLIDTLTVTDEKIDLEDHNL